MSTELNVFKTVRTSVSKLPKTDELVDTIREYSLVLQHTLDGVDVLSAAEYEELPTDLLELRAFNESGELHLVMVGEDLRGRIRTDGTGDEQAVFDEEHLVWGNDVSAEGDFVVLSEDRGTRVRIPASALLCNATPDSKNRVTVCVRNYLDEDGEDPESGDTRFAFCDYRLVGLKVREVE